MAFIIPSIASPISSLQVKLAASQVKGAHIPHDIPRLELTTFIRSIISNQEDPKPFYVLDLGVLVNLMEKWNHCLPNVRPFFAVKCNNEPAFLAAMATLGASFDCASKAEIEAVLSHGVSPSKIVYANPCKGEYHLKHAASVGVNLATFDSMDEVTKIRKCHPKCSLLLRIAVPNDKSSWRALGTKFGALPEEVAPLLRHAHRAGSRVVGISFHVGSKASESKVYRGAIAAARAAYDVADELEMPKMHVLDIGGGFKANPLFDEIAETINDAIKDYFPESHDDLDVIAEPGRFFAETAFTMVANVMGKRVRGEKREYWISDGIYGSFNLPAYDRSSMIVSPLHHSHHLHTHNLVPATYPSTVFGPTCDSLDTVVDDCKLPELELNDFLVFHNMGAYTTSAATNFNGFNISAIPTYLTFTSANS
ncbi:hypothetical protein M0R45_001052 [Rubus argutus]|uniref:ornithine decarboxylase n=1 Tax=Rubus argutus TaxID=59490 RepID=A0AAW1VJ30_RUBAR